MSKTLLYDILDVSGALSTVRYKLYLLTYLLTQTKSWLFHIAVNNSVISSPENFT